MTRSDCLASSRSLAPQNRGYWLACRSSAIDRVDLAQAGYLVAVSDLAMAAALVSDRLRQLEIGGWEGRKEGAYPAPRERMLDGGATKVIWATRRRFIDNAGAMNLS